MTVTREHILAAIVAGDRTERDLAARFGTTGHTPGFGPDLDSLLRDGLLHIQGPRYFPTAKGRALVAAAVLVDALTGRAHGK